MTGLSWVLSVHQPLASTAERAEPCANFAGIGSTSWRCFSGSCRWDAGRVETVSSRVSRKLRSGVRVSTQSMGQSETANPSTGDTILNSTAQLVNEPRIAADVVQGFYDSFNRRDLSEIRNLFADDCEYEDLNYPQSKKGREEIAAFLEKVMSSMGSDLKFVIDDMTRDDPNSVGVIWHLDWRGKAFPFSKGCSFYRCEMSSHGQRQIRYARDVVEPATRPGNLAMGVIRLVISLLETFPWLADRL